MDKKGTFLLPNSSAGAPRRVGPTRRHTELSVCLSVRLSVFQVARVLNRPLTAWRGHAPDCRVSRFQAPLDHLVLDAKAVGAGQLQLSPRGGFLLSAVSLLDPIPETQIPTVTLHLLAALSSHARLLDTLHTSGISKLGFNLTSGFRWTVGSSKDRHIGEASCRHTSVSGGEAPSVSG